MVANQPSQPRMRSMSLVMLINLCCQQNQQRSTCTIKPLLAFQRSIALSQPNQLFQGIVGQVLRKVRTPGDCLHQFRSCRIRNSSSQPKTRENLHEKKGGVVLVTRNHIDNQKIVPFIEIGLSVARGPVVSQVPNETEVLQVQGVGGLLNRTANQFKISDFPTPPRL